MTDASVWTFATANPGTALIMVFLIVLLIRSIFYRIARALCIWKHGWPEYPVDADGDIVSSTCEECEDEDKVYARH